MSSKIAERKVRGKWLPALLCFVSLCLIGFIDASIDYRISLLVFYILPVGYATIRVGPAYATFLSIFAIVCSKAADLSAGMPYPGLSILLWNGTVALSFFVIVIGLLRLLNRQMMGLESTVRARTQDLLDQMSERGRLERELTEISEREHRRLGQELHDLVCQELAGIAIDAHLLTRQLLGLELGEAEKAREIALKVDRALTKARNVARGFVTAGFDSAGLVEALRESARQIEKGGRISCVVNWQKNLVITDEDAVAQLYRIAQEAIRNAERHAAASHIEVTFECKENVVQMSVTDNGKGFLKTDRKGKGIGLNIMAYRTSLIGGAFKVEQPVNGGTRVVCTVPTERRLQPLAKSGTKG